MKKKIVFTIFIIIFTAISAYGEELKKIDLKTAVNIAQENNLDIKSSQKDVEIAKNEIEIANHLRNPSFDAFWNFGRAGKGNANQIGLTQTIELFKRAPRKKLAKVNYQLVIENNEYKKFKLKMDVAEAYVKLVVAKSILERYERQQNFLENLLLISKRQKDKDELTLDVIEAKIALNQIITEVNKAKTNAKTARIEFNKIINSTICNYDTLDLNLTKEKDVIGLNLPVPSAKLPSFKEIENVAIKNRYDIKIAKNEIDVAKKNLSVVMRQRIPDVDISGGYAYQTMGLSDDGRYKSGAYLGASLTNIPVFYSYKPEIRNAQLEIEKANLNYLSTVNKAKKSVEIAYENFVTAQLNLESYNDKILKDSEELFTLFEKKYKVEEVDFATLAAVEESYQDIVVGYSEALSDYYIEWINFLREINFEKFSFENQSL